MELVLSRIMSFVQLEFESEWISKKKLKHSKFRKSTYTKPELGPE